MHPIIQISYIKIFIGSSQILLKWKEFLFHIFIKGLPSGQNWNNKPFLQRKFVIWCAILSVFIAKIDKKKFNIEAYALQEDPPIYLQ